MLLEKCEQTSIIGNNAVESANTEILIPCDLNPLMAAEHYIKPKL